MEFQLFQNHKTEFGLTITVACVGKTFTFGAMLQLMFPVSSP